MPSPEADRPLVVILGPTAVGKTEFSIGLAVRFGAEIVSADSRLLYRGMNIGTAKPSAAERRQVPHHLIDVAEPDEIWSLAEYQRAAYQTIDGIHKRGQLPFLVGGTGQYIRSVLEGWQIPALAPDRQLRATLERWAEEIGSAGIHARLHLLDPEAASRIDPANLRRGIRALEVILRSGRKYSEQRRRSGAPYRLCVLGLSRPRNELYLRIDARINAMIDAGLVQEVAGLLAAGIDPELPCMTAISYGEISAHLRGHYSLDEAIRRIRRRTRQFVRRQANWFKPDDPQIQWLDMDETAFARAEQLLHSFLDGTRK